MTAGALAATGSWGTAIEVPGTAALNVGGSAWVSSISCATAGSCAAGGRYADGAHHYQGFVANMKDGVWQTAVDVGGLAALNVGGDAWVTKISCATADSCAAGGYYTDGSHHYQAFLVSEQNGVWGQASTVPGLTSLDLGMSSTVNSISCATAGFCAAGGYYHDGSLASRAFVVNRKNGVWGKAIGVPNSGVLNLDGGVSISCAPAGSCAAAGSNRSQVFVANERNGVWHAAVKVPGTPALRARRVYSISCATAGSCTLGGVYSDSSGNNHAFLANERNGAWQQAFNVTGMAVVTSISCATAGSCAAGGGGISGQASVANERNGVWRKAIQVPGLRGLKSNQAGLHSISCATADACAAGGGYHAFAKDHAFVVNMSNGVWQEAIEVPGSAALNVGGIAAVGSISCATADSCAAGGYYLDGSGHTQAFVTAP